MMEALQRAGLVYLAQPYSKYPACQRRGISGIRAAFEDGANLTARMLRAGVRAYNPISHTHPIAILGGINPLDHLFWLEYDEVMMERCDALCVAMMATWEHSIGIGYEIDVFKKAEKPIFYLDPTTMTVTATAPSGAAS